MSVVAAALRELVALGVSGEALIAAVERIEEAAVIERAETVEQAVNIVNRKEDAKLAARKAKDAARQREKRASKKSAESTDIHGHPQTSADGADEALAPTQVVILPSSLRSEGIPPTHPSGASPRKANGRPTRRCPEGWAPSEITAAQLASEGYSPGQLERALTMIRDHEFPKPRSDWDAAYRNWVRRDSPFVKNGHERPHTDAKFAARQANLATHERGADLAARLHGKP